MSTTQKGRAVRSGFRRPPSARLRMAPRSGYPLASLPMTRLSRVHPVRIATAEAGDHVVVYHADGLHMRVADRGADELETAVLQRGTHRVRLSRPRRNLAQGLPPVHLRLAANEPPDVLIERSELFLSREERHSVRDRRFDLQSVADNPIVRQERLHLS